MPGPKIILAHKRGEKNVRHHQQTNNPIETIKVISVEPYQYDSERLIIKNQ